MPIAIGYARVSTTDQAETGESLELQQRKIRAAAEIGDYELVDVLVDAGESAKSLHRPSAARLLDLVKARKVDAVIVHKLDRLTRSVRDLADLLDLFDRCGVALVSVTESLDTSSAAGRLVLNIMVSVGQWEREVIGERTRDALQAKKARGERVGTVPFGLSTRRWWCRPGGEPRRAAGTPQPARSPRPRSHPAHYRRRAQPAGLHHPQRLTLAVRVRALGAQGGMSTRVYGDE